MHPVAKTNQSSLSTSLSHNENTPLVNRIDDSAQPILENYNEQNNCNRCSYLKVTVLTILTSPMWVGGAHLWVNASSKTELIAGSVLVGLGTIIPCISAIEFLLRGKSCIFDSALFVRCCSPPLPCFS